MPRNYTLIFTHPSGATATFIYENGELSALAKGLDAEQFWVFKQVKSHLLRNEEDDIGIAAQMMSEHGFTAQLLDALPTLMSSPNTPLPVEEVEGEEPLIHYRSLPNNIETFAIAQTVSEIHWREGDVKPELPPHRAPARNIPEAAIARDLGPVKPYVRQENAQQTVSEIHWREGDE